MRMLILACLTTSLVAATPSIQFTGNTGGRVLACDSCGEDAIGGLAQRASLLSPGAIRIDGGGSLFGNDATASKGALLAYSYAALNYQALNIGWRDFRYGASQTQALIQNHKLPAISANLQDPQGHYLFARWHSSDSALISGLTAPPPGWDILPHLQQQLAGVHFQDPAAALKDILAECGERQLILCWYGKQALLPPLLTQLPSGSVVLCAGDPRQAQPHPGIVIATAATRGAGVTSISPDGTISTAPVLASSPAVPAIGQVIAAQIEAERANWVVPQRPPPDPAVAARFDGTDSGRLSLAATNRGLLLEVARIQRLPLDAQRQRLRIDLTVTNRVPPDLVVDHGQPNACHIPFVSRKLFLIAEGTTLCRRIAETEQSEGAINELVMLPQRKDALSGHVDFVIPSGARPTSLHLIHDRFGPIDLTLAPPRAASPEPELSGANKELSADIFTRRLSAERHGVPAPPGSRYFICELRGRSALTTEQPAVNLDPDAAATALAPIPQAFEYLHSNITLQLLYQGHLVCRRVPKLETICSPPTFIAAQQAGGELVFVVPATATLNDLRLSLGFAPFQLDPNKPAIAPASIELGPAAPHPTPLGSINDEPFLAQLLSASSPELWCGQAPPQDHEWLALRWSIVNRGPTDGALPTANRLYIGNQEPAPQATARGIHSPPERLWLPQGQRRSFEVVFALNTTGSREWIEWAGVSTGDRLPLPAQLQRAATDAQATADPGLAAATPAESGAPQSSQPSPPPPAELGALTGHARQAGGLAAVNLSADQVNAAIDKGRALLWSRLEQRLEDNSPLGSREIDPLMALALVHSGAHHQWPACNTAIRSYILETQDERTYPVGLYAMLIQAYGDTSLRGQLGTSLSALLGGQNGDGTWGYSTAPWPGREQHLKRGGLTIFGGTPLDASQRPGTALSPSISLDPSTKGGDTSTTQFAVLGLRAGESAGFHIDDTVWLRTEAALRARQNDDGGWGYDDGDESYGSMTCAGICSLLLTRHHRDIANPANDPAIRAGLTWLANNYHTSLNPQMKKWHYYYMYSIERVGRLLGTEFIGEHEWYPLGAQHLIAEQADDGSWHSEQFDEPDIPTSFALLFLTRATEGLEPEPIKRGGRGTLVTKLAPPPAQRGVYLIIDCSGSMLAVDGNETTRFQRAINAVTEIVRELPAGQPFALRAYGHRKRAIEEGATEDTELLIPPGPLSHDTALKTLAGLRARGKTPLALSLQQAADDAWGFDAGSTVVLVTDGGDDARGLDPIAQAALFADMEEHQLSIVSLAIDNPTWRKQLSAMATASHGDMTAIADAGSLAGTLRSILLGAPSSFALLDDAGQEIFRGRFGDQHECREGHYILSTEFLGRSFTQELWINTESTTTALFDGAAALNKPAAP
ncbi:MAG: VWA domain-containing protein [Planctomycetota bacterium]|nr:VWA domain-containing protein [Planctomycetota bacterium]